MLNSGMALEIDMESLVAYMPVDRLLAMIRGEDLPDRTKGAVLFADISGFTPLTEVLARELGSRRGAEELTKQLNAVYGALIAEVHRYRGSVTGFSGDAITCWFDGDDGLRAIACGLAMQQVMGQFAHLQTPKGTAVSVAIKVAVSVGPVRRFRVGDPQIQYIDVLAGEAVDRVAAMEKQAREGEIVVEEKDITQLENKVEIKRHLDHANRRFAVVNGLRCCVQPDPWPDLAEIELLNEAQVRPWLLPPVYEQLRYWPDRFLAEIRPAVALFLRFGGIEYDNDEAAGQKLDDYIQWVQRILMHYEGYLLQLTHGDKGSYLYAAFGAPLAHDDDSARAVAAAMELQSPPAELDFITPVRIGISRGRVRTGAYGGPTRRTYGVLGNEVNVSARLMGEARPGQILVSQRVANATVGGYHLKGPQPVKLKGLKEPLPVFEVLGQRIRLRAFTDPLIGREDELAQMEKALQTVLGGEGQILRLEGAAGIGKSRLAAEFLERAMGEGLKVAYGACQSTSQGIAYHPWRQVFRALLGLAEEPLAAEDVGAWIEQQVAHIQARLPGTNPDWLPRLPLLGDLLGLPIPDNAMTAAFDTCLRQESLFALAVEMLRSWAGRQPLLLFIDDVHWMDEASLDLTLNVSRAIADVPVLLLLVHRSLIVQDRLPSHDLDRLAYHTCLSLRELSPEDIAALANHRLRGQLSPLALSLIQIQAQGNPFFAEELVDALRASETLLPHDDGTWRLCERLFEALHDANCLVKQDGDWVLSSQVSLSAAELGIPDSVQDIVLSRIDRLPEEHKLTLKVAAVIGYIFEFDLLAHSHPHHPTSETLLAQLRDMEARGLIRPELPPPQLAYMFRHHITCETTYDILLEDQQRELHGGVGRALEALRPDAVERLAYHYGRGGVRDKTLFYLDKAARKAQQEHANEMALNYYKQALALEERWEWRKGQVEVWHILGRRADELAGLEALAALPEAPAPEVAFLRGQYYEELGNYREAQADIEETLSASRSAGDIASEARCLSYLGRIARRQGDYEKAKDWYQQALALIQERNVSLDEEVRALNGLGTAQREQGDYDQARECYQRALTLSRQSGNHLGEAKALNNLGVTAFYQSDFAAAAAYHGQALEIRRAIGDRAGEGASLGNLALAVRDAGDYEQAWQYLSEALTIQQAIGNRRDEANVWNDIGVIYLLVGNLPEASTCFETGLRLSREIGDAAGQVYFLGNLGLMARDQGNLAEAEKLLSEGLALAQKQGDRPAVAHFLSHLGIVSLMTSRRDQALEQAGVALAMRQELALRLWTTPDLATLAAAHLAAGNAARAASYAHQAIAVLDECGGQGPEYPYRDYFVCYQVLSAAGQEEAASSALRAAYNLVMAHAEKIADPALRQSFLERVQINREIVREYGSVKREA
jgi:adenylate cyclase